MKAVEKMSAAELLEHILTLAQDSAVADDSPAWKNAHTEVAKRLEKYDTLADTEEDNVGLARMMTDEELIIGMTVCRDSVEFAAIKDELRRRLKSKAYENAEYRAAMVTSFAFCSTFAVTQLWKAHKGRVLNQAESEELGTLLHTFFQKVR